MKHKWNKHKVIFFPILVHNSVSFLAGKILKTSGYTFKYK